MKMKDRCTCFSITSQKSSIHPFLIKHNIMAPLSVPRKAVWKRMLNSTIDPYSNMFAISIGSWMLGAYPIFLSSIPTSAHPPLPMQTIPQPPLELWFPATIQWDLVFLQFAYFTKTPFKESLCCHNWPVVISFSFYNWGVLPGSNEGKKGRPSGLVLIKCGRVLQHKRVLATDIIFTAWPVTLLSQGNILQVHISYTQSSSQGKEQPQLIAQAAKCQK